MLNPFVVYELQSGKKNAKLHPLCSRKTQDFTIRITLLVLVLQRSSRNWFLSVDPIMSPGKLTATGADLEMCQRSSIVFRLTSVKGISALSAPHQWCFGSEMGLWSRRHINTASKPVGAMLSHWKVHPRRPGRLAGAGSSSDLQNSWNYKADSDCYINKLWLSI